MPILSAHDEYHSLHLTINKAPLSSQSNIVKIRLSTNDHPPLSSKVEIGRSLPEVNLANELARGIPYVDTIATSGIHVAFRITVNACSPTRAGQHILQHRIVLAGSSRHTVGCAGANKSEGLPVIEGTVLFHVEAIAARQGLVFLFCTRLFPGRGTRGNVHRSGASKVHSVKAVVDASIGDVCVFTIGRERETF